MHQNARTLAIMILTPMRAAEDIMLEREGAETATHLRKGLTCARMVISGGCAQTVRRHDVGAVLLELCMNLNTSVHGSKCVHWTASTILLEFCMRLNREPVFDSCRDRVVPRDLSRIP